MDKTLTEACGLLSESKSIILSTHVMPDGDGLGAEIALYYYLKRLGKKVRIVNPDPLPKRYEFLDRAKVIEIIGGKKATPENADLWIVVDTNDPKRLGDLWSSLQKKVKSILFLDHHPKLEGEEGNHAGSTSARIHELVDVKSSSIGELLYRLFHAANDILDPHSTAFHLSPEIALGLYVSIITDTNSFRYARTTALSHRIAAELIDFGLQPEQIYQEVYSTKTKSHLRLIGEVLSQVEEVKRPAGGTIAWVEISKELREKHGATSDDTQTIVNFLLLLKDAEILVLLREEDDGKIKASIKSKGTIKVNDIAQEFGGGGHEFAAGFSIKGSIDDIKKKLITKLSRI